MKLNIVELMKEQPDLFLVRFGQALELLESVASEAKGPYTDDWTGDIDYSIPANVIDGIKEFLNG